MTTLDPVYGSREFYQAKAEKMKVFLEEYVDLMFPTDEQWKKLTPGELRSQAHTARVRACWTIEMVMELGLTNELIALIADRAGKDS